MAAVELSFQTWGKHGLPTVLLIHGMADCAHIWEPLAQGLADRFHCVAPDLRGHGGSPRPGVYTPEAYLEDIEAFAAAQRLEAFSVIGHSFGGLIGVGYALRHPKQVRALVSVDINIPPPAGQIERLRAAGAKPHQIFPTREAAVAYLRKTIAPAAKDEMLQSLADALLMPDTTGLMFNFDREILAQAAPMDVAGQLAQLRCPTMFLRGGESTVMDPNGAIAMLHQLDHSRLVQIPRAGHYVFLDNPKAVVHEVRLFLVDALHTA
jgi:pimeloyl-ACP methyl ester carboxylesterase